MLVYRLILLLIFPLACSGVSLACSCTDEPSHSKTFRKAKAVFIGRLLEKPDAIQEVSSQSAPSYHLKFEVVKAWKGVKGDTFSAATKAPNMCSAFEFREGGEYLLYAFEGSFVSADCASSSELSSEVSSKRMKDLDRFWFRFRSRLWLL